MDALLSMAMREGETFKTYSNWYWKMYNEVDGDFEYVAVRTFKVGLPTKHDLRKYKRLEEDENQGKGKAKGFLEKRDPRGGGYHSDRPRRDFPSHPTSEGVHMINSLFKEPIHQILEKIKK